MMNPGSPSPTPEQTSSGTAAEGSQTNDAPRRIAVPWAVLLGFSAFASWTNMLLCFEGSLRDHIVYGGGVIHDPFFFSSLLVAMALLLLAAGYARRHPSSTQAGEVAFLGSSRPALGLCVVLGTIAAVAGVVLAAIADQDAAGLRLASSALGAVTGTSLAAFTLCWGRVMAALALRPALLVMGSALCIQWPLLSLAIVGGFPAKIVAVAALPLLSWGCLAKLAPKTAAANAEPPTRAKKGSPSPLDPSICRIAGALFCFCLVIQFVWTCHIGFGENPLDANFFWMLFLLVFAVVLAVTAISLALMRRWKSYRTEFFYRASFLFAAVACAGLDVLPVAPLLPYVGIYAAYALIMLTMWTLAWSVVFLKGINPDRAFGAVFGVQFAALIAGFSAAKVLEWAVGTSGGAALLPWISVAAVALLACAFCFILPERCLLELSPRLTRLNRAGLEERCEALAAQFGLTAREAEVFSYLARGRDVGFIEQELFISRNTVNTHRKNLYRKLGIHTQQELLSLIEEPEGVD